ncbi:hypothetical protein D3C83_17020 [compost metagenome]
MAVTISGESQRPSFSRRRARMASGPIIWLAVMENWWKADQPGLLEKAIGM